MKRSSLYLASLVLATLFCLSASASDKVTIHLMGDSTCAPKDLSKGSPERGWGMMFPNFLDSGATVINHARNGRSTRSIQLNGEWDAIRESVGAGDYVFIQYGHNDGKESDPDRFAAPWGEYQKNLELFISTVRAKGAIPVLLTPVSRRWFKADTLDMLSLGDYPAAMREVAKKTGTALLDIYPMTQEWLTKLGDEASRPYYMYDWNPAKIDNTHTRPAGARKLAVFVAEALKADTTPELDPLREHLLAEAPRFVVAKDGTGDFFTVQEAIDACPDYSHAGITSIYIKPGVYREMVTIPHNKFRLHIYGDDPETTVISWGKYATQTWPDSDATVGTSGSASMYIHSSYVTMENITVENTAGEGKEIGQAVALFTDGDFLFFRNCRLVGNQDTLYTYGRYGKEGGVTRNYYLDCYIEGTTDFIFGPSICYFENCTLHSKKNSYVTAASTFEGQKYGYVFVNCRLTAAPGIDKVYLGRPWGAYAKTVFIKCELGDHIVADGWQNWNKPGKPVTEKCAYYAEYQNYGPGAAPKSRVKWSHQLTAKQAGEYTFEKVMYQAQDGIVWDPYDNQ